MDHRDHVALLRSGVVEPGGIWADFGSGGGAFTLALAELLGPGGRIISIDRDRRSLGRQVEPLRRQFPTVAVDFLLADFTTDLDLLPLDGLVMANALHFIQDKQPVLEKLRSYLKPGGRFLLVEYDVDRGNRWVPYPLSFSTWQTLAAKVGLQQTELLQRRPSRFLSGFYSALSRA